MTSSIANLVLLAAQRVKPRRHQILFSKILTGEDESKSGKHKRVSYLSRYAGQRLICSRKYRERNQNYAKALEEEVDRLRELRSVNKEHKEAESENRILKDLAASNGLSLPESISHQSQSTDRAAELSLIGPLGPQQFLQAQPAGDAHPPQDVQDSGLHSPTCRGTR
jgi:hypothetical protein